MAVRSNVFPIIRIQESNIVSSTKAIIETHVATRPYYNHSDRIIRKNTIRVPYTTETVSRLTVTNIDCRKAGFH